MFEMTKSILLVVVAVYIQKSFTFIVQRPTLIELFPPSCNSQIYCYGRLLHTVQMSNIFKDSKTFVDMKLQKSPNETLIKFEEMMKAKNDEPTSEDIKEFVDQYFMEPGKEFEPWEPNDWKEKPTFLEKLRDPDLKQWASDLNGIWKILGRKMTKDVAENPNKYSIIHVDHPVIVPGGRFREFYYWDSYWIIRGLLYSEMYSTVRGMLKNFLDIIERFGFIPNGGRIYYSKRSQPPLLAPMIKSYVDKTNDLTFAIESVKILEHEFQFWMNNHTYEIKGYHLATYGDKSSGPRPESYREDIKTSEEFPTDEAKQEHYSELKAAAESGMDFSSRWFIDSNGTNQGKLYDLKTRSIIPVELNAILYWNAKIISEFYSKMNNTVKAKEYEEKAHEIYTAIQNILWDEEIGVWLDFDMINNKRRNYFTPTNLSPLWMKCYNTSESQKLSERILSYIEKMGLDNYPGGVPNTLQNTGEQWDFPNVWPPMQYILIIGLNNLNTNKSRELALKWVQRWVLSNFQAYKDSRQMYEKYNAEEFGVGGGGGEYEVQIGFGWTNGVIIELLEKFGDILTTTGSATNITGPGHKMFLDKNILLIAIFIGVINQLINYKYY